MAEHGSETGSGSRSSDPLERLRGWRTEPEHLAMSEAVAGELSRLAEARRRRGSFEAAWAACAPAFGDPSLRAELVRGTIKIRCRSASARFAADQWLRRGGLRALREACNTPIRGYRLHTA